MAWSYRGAAYDYGFTGNTITVSKPSGTTTGDFALALVCRYYYADPTSEPSGWTLLESWADVRWANYRLYYRVIGADDPSSWSWEWAGNARHRVWLWTFYGDYDTSDPIQASDMVYYTTAAKYIDIPTLTTDADDTISLLVTTVIDTISSPRTFDCPTSPAYTEHDESGDTSSGWWAAIASYIYSDADTATGTLAYDWQGNYATIYRAGFHVLLNPASGSEPEAYSGSASISASASTSATGKSNRKASASISETASATAQGVSNRYGAAAISETATLTAEGSGQESEAYSGAASITETATLTATGVSNRQGAASITETVTTTATGAGDETEAYSGAAAITATAALTAAGTAGRAGAAALTGAAALLATRRTGRSGAALLTADVVMAVTGRVSRIHPPMFTYRAQGSLGVNHATGGFHYDATGDM